jgi:glycosyltransferase involved in cell wall biosynthesis
MLVSVIIPSYNHAKFLRHTVESVLNQTYKRIELIIIDDGSTDDSVAYLQSVDDSRFRFYAQENQGAHNAINRGLSIAQGDFLTILNSDDAYHPERIQRLLGRLEESGAALACSWIEVIDAQGVSTGIKKGWENMLPSWTRNTPSGNLIAGDPFSSNLLISNFISTTSNLFFKRSVYSQLEEMRNLRFSHDWDFALRAAASFPCEIVTEPLLKYRVHETNTIRSDHQWMMLETCWVLAANLDSFGDKMYPHGRFGDGHTAWVLKEIGDTLVPKDCDRVFWMLKHYIDASRRFGSSGNDEEILVRAETRSTFYRYLGSSHG